MYAQILAAVGSFAIAAVVIAFTARPKASTLTPLLLGYAAGLLVLGLISSLAGAFNFAAIGAEKELTPNLVASTVYSGATVAVAVGVGVVAILAAFVVLARIYLPDSKSLFAMMTAGGAIIGSSFVPYVLCDSWVAYLEATTEERKQWLADQRRAHNAAWIYMGVVMGTVAVGAGLYFSGHRIHLTGLAIRWLIGVGIGLVVLLHLGAMLRTNHPVGKPHRGLRRLEARILLGIMAAYLAVVIVCLP